MKTILIFIFLILFPICGIQALSEGNIGMGLVFLSPLIFVICIVAYILFFQMPQEKRQEALQKKYNLPQVVRNDYGKAWDDGFQNALAKAIESTSDASKLSDLQRCQSVAKELNKGSFTSPYQKINNAFRLTGCHLTITDSQGKVITKIV